MDKVRLMGGGYIQGKEYLRTITRRSKGSYSNQVPKIDNPFVRHSKKQRDAFCAKIMGTQGRNSTELCRSALEKE